MKTGGKRSRQGDSGICRFRVEGIIGLEFRFRV